MKKLNNLIKSKKLLVRLLAAFIVLIIIASYGSVAVFALYGGMNGVKSVQNSGSGYMVVGKSGGGTDEVIQSNSPSVSTSDATNLGLTTATLNGNLTNLGGLSTVNVYFEYGSTTAYGSTTPLVAQTAIGAFNANLTGLVINSSYHFRAVVSFSGGSISVGNDYTFTTGTAGNPTATTESAINITTTGATLQGTLTGLGNESTVYCYFEYGTTVAYGSQTADQTKTTIGSYNASITGLTTNTTYHYRAVVRYATASYAYGVDATFSTLSSGGAPSAPTNFQVSTFTTTSITLTWTKASGATNTLIRWSTTSYPTTPTEGTQLYSGTASTTSHAGLTTNTRYYYSAWSETGGVYSNTYATATGVPSADVLPAPDTFQIESLQIYSDYQSTGDQLIVFSTKIIWTAGQPTTYNPSDFFYMQVYDGSDLIKQDRIKIWGYVPGSLYVSQTTPLVWGKDYTFELKGTSKFSTPPVASYAITAANYVGNNYDNLSQWTTDLASRMEQSSYWNGIQMLDYSKNPAVLTSQATQIFNNFNVD